jgi:hypothetical protein
MMPQHKTPNYHTFGKNFSQFSINLHYDKINIILYIRNTVFRILFATMKLFIPFLIVIRKQHFLKRNTCYHFITCRTTKTM